MSGRRDEKSSQKGFKGWVVPTMIFVTFVLAIAITVMVAKSAAAPAQIVLPPPAVPPTSFGAQSVPGMIADFTDVVNAGFALVCDKLNSVTASLNTLLTGSALTLDRLQGILDLLVAHSVGNDDDDDDGGDRHLSKSGVPFCPALPRLNLQQSANVPRTDVNTTDGFKIRAQEWGLTDHSAPTLLLIHGYAQTWMYWLQQLTDQRLTENFRIVTFTWRGSGYSDKPIRLSDFTNATQWAEDLNAVMTQLDVQNPVLVGHSYGPPLVMTSYIETYGDSNIAGYVGIGAEIAFPVRHTTPAMFEIVTRILFNPINLEPQVEVAIYAQEDFNGFLTGPNCEFSLADRVTISSWNLLAGNVARDPDTGDVLNIAHFFVLGTNVDGATVLPSSTVPMLIIHGTLDKIVAATATAEYAAARPDATVQLWKDFGHSPQMEDPQTFNAELCRFARTATGATFSPFLCGSQIYPAA